MAAAFESNGNPRPSAQMTPAEVVQAQLAQVTEEPWDLIERLNDFVGYELRRRIAMGQLDSTTLQEEEVVDHAFASVLTRLREGVPIRNLHSYLRSRAQEMIRREVRRFAMEQKFSVSLDQVLADDDDGEPVRLADVLPDTEARTLEDTAVDAETLNFLIDSLAALPDAWRSVLLERTVEGKSVERIAGEQDLDVDEVRRMVIRSRDFLRDRMEHLVQPFDLVD